MCDKEESLLPVVGEPVCIKKTTRSEDRVVLEFISPESCA